MASKHSSTAHLLLSHRSLVGCVGVVVRVLVFGNDDDDEEYVSSLGCELSGVEEADFLLARGPFLVLDGSGSSRKQRYSSAAHPEHLHSSPEFRSIAQAAIRR